MRHHTYQSGQLCSSQFWERTTAFTGCAHGMFMMVPSRCEIDKIRWMFQYRMLRVLHESNDKSATSVKVALSDKTDMAIPAGLPLTDRRHRPGLYHKLTKSSLRSWVRVSHNSWQSRGSLVRAEECTCWGEETHLCCFWHQLSMCHNYGRRFVVSPCHAH